MMAVTTTMPLPTLAELDPRKLAPIFEEGGEGEGEDVDVGVGLANRVASALTPRRVTDSRAAARASQDLQKENWDKQQEAAPSERRLERIRQQHMKTFAQDTRVKSFKEIERRKKQEREERKSRRR